MKQASKTVSFQQRWHDKNPVIAEAIHVWERYPLPLQRVLAKQIILYIKKEKMITPLSYIFTSRKLITSLVLSYRSRRWYDRDPSVQKAFRTLILISHLELLDMAKRILQLRAYLEVESDKGQRFNSEKEFEQAITTVFNNPDPRFFKIERGL